MRGRREVKRESEGSRERGAEREREREQLPEISVRLRLLAKKKRFTQRQADRDTRTHALPGNGFVVRGRLLPDFGPDNAEVCQPTPRLFVEPKHSSRRELHIHTRAYFMCKTISNMKSAGNVEKATAPHISAPSSHTGTTLCHLTGGSSCPPWL